MRKTKYIVIDTPDGPELPVVFSELMTHKEVAMRLHGKAVGAGFCEISKDQFHCYGRSESLNVDSRYAEDSKILNRSLNFVNQQ